MAPQKATLDTLEFVVGRILWVAMNSLGLSWLPKTLSYFLRPLQHQQQSGQIQARANESEQTYNYRVPSQKREVFVKIRLKTSEK